MRQHDGGAASSNDVRHFLGKIGFGFVGETVLRSDVTSGGDVVDDFGARFERGVGDGGAVRIDRDWDGKRFGQSLYDRSDAADFFRFADRFRTWARAFAADVEHRRAVADELARFGYDGV